MSRRSTSRTSASRSQIERLSRDRTWTAIVSGSTEGKKEMPVPNLL